MSDTSFKSIRNGAIASIIAGVVIWALPEELRSHVFSPFSWLWTGIIWCWEALISSYSLPGWAWLVILLFALVGLINICIRMKEPEYKSYIEDSIHGAKWRWHWQENQISNTWCFCPTCDATLVYEIDVLEPKVYFKCENCKHKVVATVNGRDTHDVIGAVEREISRRIRTREYRR